MERQRTARARSGRRWEPRWQPEWCQIPWYATLFRGDRFAEALGEIAPLATRYGATDYRVYRNRDDMYRFNQMADVRGQGGLRGLLVRRGVQRLADRVLGLVPDPDPLHLERPDLSRAASTPTVAADTATRPYWLAELLAPAGQPHVELVQRRGLDHRRRRPGRAPRSRAPPSPRRSRPRRARPRARPEREGLPGRRRAGRRRPRPARSASARGRRASTRGSWRSSAPRRRRRCPAAASARP